MNRRDFIKASSQAAVAGTLLAGLPGAASGEDSDERLRRRRFGLNYVPSQNWYYCWNDWEPDHIARDFDSIAAVGADHIRIMLIWPWFQPNPVRVSQAHIARLEELMRLAGQRNLDVIVTLYTGALSGYRFNLPYLLRDPFYSAASWRAPQRLFLAEIGRSVASHPNFLGFDIGNEINCNWSCPPADGDSWMSDVFQQMHALSPGRIHVNGVDHRPWFTEDTFSPRALVDDQEIVALHCWPFWTGAGKFGAPLDKPYTHLPAAMAALARSHGDNPSKPIWVEEFGVCSAEMPEGDVPKWMEIAITKSVQEGVSWFTWWASHDVDRRFAFNDFEYDLGLITVDNRIKDRGRMFQKLAESYRNQPVVIPSSPLPAPPNPRTVDTTWKWLLNWMEWKRA
jgi:hypothetical protein